jgi:hypothetical protein
MDQFEEGPPDEFFRQVTPQMFTRAVDLEKSARGVECANDINRVILKTEIESEPSA